MDQTTRRALTLLLDIKSLAFATVNEGIPDIRIINIMLIDEEGLYFTTARGKPFYGQLIRNPKVAVCGMDQNYVSVRLIGDARHCDGRRMMEKIFEFNQGVRNLYPDQKGDILEAFHVYRGRGEIFDLSLQPPKRERFAFGGETINPTGYRITDKCTACGACLAACPVDVIREGTPYRIDESSCLECGLCAEVCPEDAIDSSKGL